jgi:hypothetical protein
VGEIVGNLEELSAEYLADSEFGNLWWRMWLAGCACGEKGWSCGCGCNVEGWNCADKIEAFREAGVAVAESQASLRSCCFVLVRDAKGIFDRLLSDCKA